MSHRPTRHQRAMRRAFAYRPPPAPCVNCGQPESHYAPPSLGEPGFFTCRSVPAFGDAETHSDTWEPS